jgi:hypothetical protein
MRCVRNEHAKAVQSGLNMALERRRGAADRALDVFDNHQVLRSVARSIWQ